MTTVTVLIGAPGAGKSTWLKSNQTDEYVADTHAVRAVKGLDVDVYMNHFRQAALTELRRGRSIIIDATNTYRHHRRPWLAAARAAGAQARAVALDTPLHALLAAQRTRAHPVPQRIVIKHHQLMRLALIDLPTEGWDAYEVIVRDRNTPRQAV
jgi:predicted kinase